MNATEIRQSFLDFFRSKGHTIVPSAPVVPQDDPTLMFTNAGMNQFKPYFLGLATSPHDRIADSQKCIRVSGKHNDLEEVGHDTYHHTLFEMLGNWSIGDYYKKEAITWAWELLTEVWKLPKERLYATVFGGDSQRGLDADTEAERLWQEVTDIEHSHIMRCGAKDNFWMMGEVGPCGPCSEIHIDLTPDATGGKLVNSDSPLVMELWNLVFMSFNAEADGTLSPLPKCHIDTGAGLDRLAAVMECTHNCTDFSHSISNYDTVLFQPIIKELEKLSGRHYTPGLSHDADSIALRVCADHLRMVSFSIADGALPSNEGRGYVIRRILRRAARYGRNLGLTDPFLYTLVPVLIEVMGAAYPELKREEAKITKIIKGEETSFHQTLERGLTLFDDEAKKLAAGSVFPGDVAFRLYDTFGFPFDLTEVLARERGLSVDGEGFQANMAEQKARARAAHVKTSQIAESEDLHLPSTTFLGYDQLECEAEVLAIVGQADHQAIVLNQTPFYGEMGGQVGDTGIISLVGDVAGESCSVHISDTKQREGVFLHFLAPGAVCSLKAGDKVLAQVERERRLQIQRHHTATHLLHHALREVLGTDVHQQGSLVAPDRLRFDFTCSEAVGAERLAQIEAMINAQIIANTGVSWFEMPYKEKPDCVTAFFGDKYGEVVRTINVGGQASGGQSERAFDGFSLELCGGTHTSRTGDIGMFRFISEGAIAAGVRRVEAVVGSAAYRSMREDQEYLAAAAERVHAAPAELAHRIDALLDNQKKLEKELAEAKRTIAQAQTADLASAAVMVDGVPVLAHIFPDADAAYLRQAADELRAHFAGIAVLAGTDGGKVSLLTLVTPDYVKQGHHAGKLIKRVASELGGGGGGRPDLAQAGAKDTAKLPEVMANIASMLAH